MSDTMMSLGEVEFSVKAPYYDTLRRSNEYRWATLDRLVRQPATQWIGPGVEQIELAGEMITTLNPSGGEDFIGTKSLDKLREMAAEGEPQLLIDGMGTVYGDFCVLSVTEDQASILSNGAPRRQAFTVALQRYGEDE